MFVPEESANPHFTPWGKDVRYAYKKWDRRREGKNELRQPGYKKCAFCRHSMFKRWDSRRDT